MLSWRIIFHVDGPILFDPLVRNDFIMLAHQFAILDLFSHVHTWHNGSEREWKMNENPSNRFNKWPFLSETDPNKPKRIHVHMNEWWEQTMELTSRLGKAVHWPTCVCSLAGKVIFHHYKINFRPFRTASKGRQDRIAFVLSITSFAWLGNLK